MLFEILFLMFFAALIVFVFYRLHLVIKDAQDTRDYYFNRYKELLGEIKLLKEERRFYSEDNLKLEYENRKLRQINGSLKQKTNPIKQEKIINKIRNAIQIEVSPKKYDEINSLLDEVLEGETIK